MLPLNRAHKLPQISQISQNFPPSTSPANLQPKLLGFGSMSPHKPDLMACFFSRMVSLWRVIPATWPWVGSQIPNKGNQLKWDIFKKKDLFFPIFWNVKKQVIQMVSPPINATRDSSNSPRRHCDTVWPCSAACLYLKLLRYGKDHFNINRQARKTNDT